MLEVRGDAAGAVPDVVIAHAGEGAKRSAEVGQDAGGREQSIGKSRDEIACEDDEIGPGIGGDLDGALEGERGSPVIDMEVG